MKVALQQLFQSSQLRGVTSAAAARISPSYPRSAWLWCLWRPFTLMFGVYAALITVAGVADPAQMLQISSGASGSVQVSCMFAAAALCRYNGVVHHMLLLLLLLLPARSVLLPLRGFALLIFYLIEARRLQHLCLQPALEIAE
jgi:hypothetical protein